MTLFAFGQFVLDTDRIEISDPAGPLTFEPQIFDVLRVLIEAEGHLVTKEELLDSVWGGRFVSESGMTTRIKQARRLIGDDGRKQWAIKTVHGKGYRFVAEVEIKSDSTLPQDSLATPRPRHNPVPELSIPCIGRETETKIALEILDNATGQQTSWIWLLGEPGIGKTHLATHLAHLAQDRGFNVLLGRCNEDLPAPYQPIIEALRNDTDSLPGDELAAQLGPLANELVLLLPDLTERLEGLTPPRQSDPATDRYRLFEAVSEWLKSASLAQPLLIIVDDAHWATESTLHLLEHLGRCISTNAITFIVTARDTDPDSCHALSDLIAKGQGSATNAVIRIGGLDAHSAADLLAHDAGDRDAHHLDIDAALEQTDGNPLLLRALGPDDKTGVDLRSAVRRRSASLKPEVLHTLQIASIVGTEFDLKVVAGAVDRDELEVLQDLERAAAARLIVEVGTDRFMFVHALIRASMRDELTSTRRARWHARIALAIESQSDAPNNDQVVALAHHYLEASHSNLDLRPTAIECLRKAAANASTQLSFGDAAAHLQNARSLTEKADTKLRAELALAQGDAERAAGLSLVALESFDVAFSDATESGDATLIAEAALKYEDVSWRPGRFGGPAVERLRAAEANVDVNDTHTLARLKVALMRAHALSGNTSASTKAWTEAENLIAHLDDIELEARALNAYLSNLNHQQPPDPVTIALLERLVDLLELVNNHEELNLGRQVQMIFLARRARFDEYRQVHAQLSEATLESRSLFWDYIHANHNAMLALYEGNLQLAEEVTEACMDISENLVDEDNSGTYGLRMFMIRKEQDLIRPLLPVVKHLAANNEADSIWTPGLALLMAQTGDTEHASALLESYLRNEYEIPNDAMWSTLTSIFIELAVILENVEACRLLYDRFRGQSGLMVVTGHGIICFGSSDRFLGMLALTLGEFKVAETHLTVAIETDEANGSPLWTAHAQLCLARLRGLQSRNDEALVIATGVANIAEEYSYTALGAAAKKFLASHATEPGG